MLKYPFHTNILLFIMNGQILKYLLLLKPSVDPILSPLQ